LLQPSGSFRDYSTEAGNRRRNTRNGPASMTTDVIIVGAGPYGLSIAASLRGSGVSNRIFGTPMSTWRDAMPAGMFLKSEGFASNLYGAGKGYTLQEYCAQREVPYQSEGLPVRLNTFTAYGQAFQQLLVPHLEQKQVTGVARTANGYRVELDTGESCEARRVVVAAGITHFAQQPALLSGLPAERAGHASRFPDPARFAGQDLAVVGAGASATDYAALAAQAGARVTLIARAPQVRFLGPPTGRRRTLMESLRAPQSGLGPGWRSRLATDAPLLFHHMPKSFRIVVAKRHLGPAGGWWTRDAIEQQVDLHVATSVQSAQMQGERIAMNLASADGTATSLTVDHVVAATGYRPELARLPFLSQELRGLPTIAGAPALSSAFESAAPGLHFVGLASVNDFGPVVRFAFGAGFTSRRLSRILARPSHRLVPGYRPAPALAATPPSVLADPA
jgi:cation diffusion facilitator CzcD-associated flavoprotein CzcO